MARRKGSLQLEKNGIWTARVRVDGRMVCRSTGTALRSEAEESLARLVIIAECGRRRTLECSALLKAWPRYEASAMAARLAPASRKTKYRVWLHFSVWMHETHPDVREPQEVTRSMAEEYLTFFQGGHAPVTCNLRICYLREMFRRMLGEEGAAESNPWEGVRLRASDGYTRRELSLDEVRRLIFVSEACGREWRMLFSLAVYTGMRLGDCCCLTWDAVNLSSSIIQIVPRKTRRYLAARPVTIPLHPELADMLRKTPPELRSGFVMDSIAKDFTQRRWVVSRTLERIFAKADIETSVMLEGRERRTPSATFHSLRHTFVSIAVNAGVPLATVQSIVGHTSTAMTRHYYHPSEVALRQAVNAIPSIGSGVANLPRPRPRGARLATLSAPTFCSRLRELEKAKSRGLISADEFLSLRQKILADA
jgi:integrase